MPFKIVLKIVFAVLAGVYALIGLVRLAGILFTSNPGTAYGGARIAGSFVPVCAGLAAALALGRSARRNIQERAASGDGPKPSPRPASEAFTAPEPPAPRTVTFSCPHCGREFVKDASLGGQKGRCLTCKHVFIVPMAPPQPPAVKAGAARPPKTSSSRSGPFGQVPTSWGIGVVAVVMVVVAFDVWFWPKSAPIDPLAAESEEKAAAPSQAAKPPARPAYPSPTPVVPMILDDLAATYPDADSADWMVLFRGREARHWNTRRDEGSIAVPVSEAPQDVKFLRLRRMDTGESLIIPVSGGRDALAEKIENRADAKSAYRWCGTNEDEWGGRHLGIAEGSLMPGGSPESHGPIVVQMEGVRGFIGSGFGHEGYGDGKTQHFGWRGKKIAPTDFEIAVTRAPLTPLPAK